MSCEFCFNSHHSSKNCDKYITDEERKKVGEMHGLCRFCFIKSYSINSETHSSKSFYKTGCQCIGWHSLEHHLAFCPDRIKGMAKQFFLPKIDQDLLQRFIQILTLEEKLSLKVSSPKAQKYISLNKIKLIDSNKNYNTLKSKNDTVILTNDFYYFSSSYDIIKKALTNKIIICNARSVNLWHIKVPDEQIFLILSSYTKNLYLINVETDITFGEIIKAAPNIVLKMENNTFKKEEKTWLQNLIQHKKGKDFQSLRIHLEKIEFNIDDMMTFMTTKVSSNALIFVTYKADPMKKIAESNQKAFDNFTNKLSKHFLPSTNLYSPTLSLAFDGHFPAKYFTLPKSKNPNQDIQVIICIM